MPQATQVDLSLISLHIEPTPNPATLKFCFSEEVIDEPIEFSSAAAAESSPLASKIFGFPWTNSVLLAPKFIAVTKQDWVDWSYLAEPLSGMIREHLNQKIPIFLERKERAHDEDQSEEECLDNGNLIHEKDSELVRQIKKAIDRDIRPVVAYDGGDVHFAELTSEGILYVKFKGACAGCPGRSQTLKNGIEVRLKELFPQINEVIGI